MTNPLPRVIAATLLAFLGVSVLGLVVTIAIIGFPNDPAKIATFQSRAVPYLPMIDLVVGAVVLFACGWWAGRPFARPLALRTGLAVVLLYIAAELIIAALRSGLGRIEWQPTLIADAVKIAAALIGAALAAQSGSAVPSKSTADIE
jgi:hypothetical protein